MKIKKSKHSIKKIFLINFVIFFSLLILTEFFFKYILEVNTQSISKNLIKFENNFFFNHSNLKNGKAFGKKVYTDANGFRIPYIKNYKNHDKIFFIGGSGTFGPGVLAEDTFVEIINIKSNFDVFNASVFGSTLENNVKIFNEKVLNKNPRHIFISLAYDDVDRDIRFDNFVIEENDSDSFIINLKKYRLPVIINKFLRSYSSTYVYLKNFLTNAPKRYYLYDLKTFTEPEKLKNSISLLNEFIFYKKQITFFILPYAEQVKENNCNKSDIAEKFYKNELIKREFNFVFLKEHFCNIKNVDDFFLKNDPAHLSKKGHKFISEIFLNLINQKLK